MKRLDASHRAAGAGRLVAWLMSAALLGASGIAGGREAPARAAPAGLDADPVAVNSGPGDADSDRPAFPLALGGDFRLVDHNGVSRSSKDFRGSYLLVFFGYVNCSSMCPVGIRRMAQALERLGDAGGMIQPVVITVDPANDTPDVLRSELPKIHPRLLGLTGDDDALAAAYRAYRLKPERVGTDLAGNTIVSHTSYIYLMGPGGELATLIAPILSPERMSEIIASYLFRGS